MMMKETQSEKNLYSEVFKLIGMFPSNFLLLDQTGVILETDRETAEKIGLKKKDLVGKKIQDMDILSSEGKTALRGQEKAEKAKMHIDIRGKEEKPLRFETSGEFFEIGARKMRLFIFKDSDPVKTLEAAFYKELVENTISAISKAVELKDPYTFGHGIRVAEIAESIGDRLELSEDKRLLLRFSGKLHDIGKLAIPVEILTKPFGTRSGLEIKLLQDHVNRSYEILKDINFPFPLAEVVYQHHERLDGSGYPRGLQGGEILIESQIVAVSDVLDAITTHRPYR